MGIKVVLLMGGKDNFQRLQDDNGHPTLHNMSSKNVLFVNLQVMNELLTTNWPLII